MLRERTTRKNSHSLWSSFPKGDVTMQDDRIQARMSEFMRANQAKLLDRWEEIVLSAVGSRVTASEVRRELEEMFDPRRAGGVRC